MSPFFKSPFSTILGESWVVYNEHSISTKAYNFITEYPRKEKCIKSLAATFPVDWPVKAVGIDR